MPKEIPLDTSKVSSPQLTEAGAHLCKLYLRDDGRIPGGLWSWKVYIDGDVHQRGPGSTRKDLLKWYAMLPKGEHGVLIREPDHIKENRIESNTIFFTVENELELIVDVGFHRGKIILNMADTQLNSPLDPDADESSRHSI